MHVEQVSSGYRRNDGEVHARGLWACEAWNRLCWFFGHLGKKTLKLLIQHVSDELPQLLTGEGKMESGLSQWCPMTAWQVVGITLSSGGSGRHFSYAGTEITFTSQWASVTKAGWKFIIQYLVSISSQNRYSRRNKIQQKYAMLSTCVLFQQFLLSNFLQILQSLCS